VDDVALPGLAPAMMVDAAPAGTALAWPAVDGATGYDVIRGSLQALRETHGDYSATPVTCLADDGSPTSVDDIEPVPAGGAYYLVRAANCGGAGSFDIPGVVAPGQRDLGLAGAPGACP